MANVEGKRKRGPTLEDVARLVLQKRAAPEPEEEEEARRPRPCVTLPRLRFLEAPRPAWWDENFELRPALRDPNWKPPL